MTTRKRLRDGLLYYRGADGTDAVTSDWPNQGLELRPYDCANSASSVFTDDHWVFAGNATEYIQTADHDALESTLTGSITALIRMTLSSSAPGSAHLLTKRYSSTATNPGWGMYRDASEPRVLAVVGDGTTNHSAESGVLTYDQKHVLCLRWDGPNSTTTMFTDGAQTDQDTTTISGSGANTYGLRIGSDHGDANRWEGNAYDVAVFREALTDTEILRLSNEMANGVDELMIGPVWVECFDAPPVFTGRGLSFATEIHGASLSAGASTLAEVQKLRAQFLGFQVGDVIPVWSSADDQINGHYEVTGPATVIPYEAYLATGAGGSGVRVHAMSVSMSLARLPRGSNHGGRIGQISTRAVRTASLTLTTGDARTRTTAPGVPKFVTVPPSYLTTTQTETGPVVAHTEDLDSANLEDNIRADVSVIDTLNGSVRIEDVSGDPFTVTDRLLHVSTPSAVRLSNGRFRAWVSNDSEITVQQWDADDRWGDTHTLELTLGGNAVTFPRVTPRIAMNSHLEATLVYPLETTTETGWELAVRLRRGSALIEIEAAGDVTATMKGTVDAGATSVAIGASPYEACIRTSVADTQSRNAHLMSPEATGTAQTDGEIDLTTATSHQFGFGLAGTSTGAAKEYFCAESFTEWVT